MKKVFLLISFLLMTGVFLQAQTVDVTFQVDMSVPIATGTFVPGTNQTELRGSFDGWGAGLVLSDGDNDSVYTVVLTSQAQSTDIFYKFFHTGGTGATWESDPNREINSGTSSTLTIDPSFFNDKTPYTGITSAVTFSVDMQLPAQGAFDPATDTVLIAGNFTDWGTGAIVMDDPDGDSIYTLTVSDFTSGDLGIYKFIWSDGSRHWESGTVGDDIIPGTDGNRIYGVHDGTNDVSRWWQNTNPTVQLADGNIFFEVDMSVAEELGVFDPDVDSVLIPGSFNGWNLNDPDKVRMNQNPANPNDWFIDIPFVQEILNSTQAYKYFIRNAPSSPPYANTGWEVAIGGNTSAGNRDRLITFEGDPTQVAPFSFFENIHTDWVIEAGTTVVINFSVDMTNAVNPDSQAVPFVPGTDSVFWMPRQPFYYAVNNLPWPGAFPRILELTDPNTDMIYTGTLTIDGPMFNGYLYNYAYSSTTGLVQEEEEQGSMRVRFVGQNGGARVFDSPWDMPLDVWTQSPKPEEFAPQGWTSVQEIPGSPQTYSLERNFPNPFNPSTKIRFSVPERGLVTLKVFNLLGEEVETLLNSELANGTYEVDFKGTSISSGIYFYTLTANNFISTKKMILLK